MRPARCRCPVGAPMALCCYCRPRVGEQGPALRVWRQCHLTAGRTASLLAIVVVARGACEQIGCLDTQDPRQPVHDIDPRGIDASFERTDIGAVDLGAMREFLLRQVACSSKPSQIERQDLSNIHAGEGSVLKSIPPRSILDNRCECRLWIVPREQIFYI